MVDTPGSVQTTSSFWDVLSGAAANAASSVISGTGERVASIINPGGEPSSAPPASQPAPIYAVNKPQPGTPIADGGAGMLGLAALAAAAFFFFRR